MHDVAVVLHGHELGHADAAEPAHAAEVVAAEVHQHDVLGPLLLVGEQLLAEPLVLLQGGPAGTSARDRPRLRPPALHADQHLGGGPRDRARAVLQEVHVRRRVHHAQGAVDREGIAGTLDAAAPREHDLEDVSGGDVVLRRAHGLPVAGAVGEEVAARVELRSPPRGGHRRRRSGTAQVGLGGIEHVLRPLEGGAASRLGVGHEHDPLPRVVERHQRAVERERSQRQAGGRVAVGDPLEQPHRVVAQVAHGSAGQSRKTGNLGRGGPHARAEGAEQVVAGTSRLHGLRRVAADEGVARDAIAAHHALEQERSRRAGGEREEGGDGRAEVAGNLAVHGHEAPASGEPLVILEGEGLHRGARRRARRTSSARANGTRRWAMATVR